jgi:hypothetical protein
LIRYVAAISVALLVLVSFELYNGVSRVKAQQSELEALKVSIVREREAIRVLKAEWSYLNQPERLQTLARQHLPLAPTDTSRIVVLASLPLKGAAPPSPPVVDASALPKKQPKVKPAQPTAAP